MGKMRESTKNKAALAVIWTTAGLPKEKIAELLHVSPVRVRRLLRTSHAHEIRTEIREQLVDAALQIRIQHMNERLPPKLSPPSLFLEKMEAFFTKHLEKHGGGQV